MPEAYFFNNHLRWTVFWENPNCWAAFLACLLAWAWGAQAGLRLRVKFKLQTGALVALYVVEAGIWFLLVKTYSRGGLVAAAAAMVFFFGLHGLSGTGDSPVGLKDKTRASRPCHPTHMGESPMPPEPTDRLPVPLFNPTGWKPVLLGIFMRVALVAVMCLAVGFASRMSPDYVAQDKSILNRVDQWKGAMVMISDSPFHGWGTKLGGMAYQDWYQPLSHTTRPIGFVNSYLEVAVEQGSHVLFLAIVFACALLLVAARLRKVAWVAAAGASLVAWLVSNLWSSIWLWAGLWILPGVAVGCIVVAAAFLNPKSRNPSTSLRVARQSQKNLKLQMSSHSQTHRPDLKGRDCVAPAAVSLAVGVVVWISILGAGHVFAKDFTFQAKPVARGEAAIVSRRGIRETLPELRTELWVDSAVTGRYWGKAIRTILEDKPCGSFIVYAPWALRSNRFEQSADRYVYSGFQAELLSDKNFNTKQIIILHPTVYPPATTPENGQHPEITVCLPAFDASPYNLPWRHWAAENGAKLIFSPQDGTRINPEQNKEFWRSLLFNE